MQIEIISSESLGVRGLCCFVRAGDRRILIDPGVALGYHRKGLLPHPCQVLQGRKIRETIINRWGLATDVVISHFHGDHCPLPNANPYQLDLEQIENLPPPERIWIKSSKHLSSLEQKRKNALVSIFKRRVIEGEGKTDGPLSFSNAVPHGDEHSRNITVMMTRIESERVFIHASDIQLLNRRSVSLILERKPDVLLAGGPPIYLGKRISREQKKRAMKNAVTLAREIDAVIIDHHIMRDLDGGDWIAEVSRQSGRRVFCSADFMKVKRKMLEAKRKRLYEILPVPEGWHERYGRGEASIQSWREKCKTPVP